MVIPAIFTPLNLRFKACQICLMKVSPERSEVFLNGRVIFCRGIVVVGKSFFYRWENKKEGIPPYIFIKFQNL